MESRKRSAEDSIGSSEELKKQRASRERNSQTRQRCTRHLRSSSQPPYQLPELYTTIAAYGCRKGERTDMQDTHIIHPKFDFGPEKSFLSRSSFFAIFDGHAGPRAAHHCQSQMGKIVKEKLAKFSDFATLTKSLKQSFTESYKSIDDAFLSQAKQNKPVWKDGATATTMIILNNVIYVANIGDSRAVVARKKDDGSFAPVCLTVDHNPMAHEERMRIQKAGATVKDGRINGVIEVSRSIGDLPFKSLGIVSTPDLKKLTITRNDLFAIIACDGLWKSFSNVEAVTYAADQLEAAKKTDIDQEPNETREVAEFRTVAEKLAAEAVRRKCGDNVSVIIIKLNVIEDV